MFPEARLIQKMLDRNIPKERIDMIDYCGVDINKWLKGFDNAEDSVRETVDIIRTHPLIPTDIQVYGFLIDPETGKLEKFITVLEYGDLTIALGPDSQVKDTGDIDRHTKDHKPK